MSNTEHPNLVGAGAERGIRDLMGLLALSALWLGKDGLTVLEQMLEAVERLVPIRFAYAEASVFPDEPSIARVRVEGSALEADQIKPWRQASVLWPKTVNIFTSGATLSPTPIGELKIVRMELGVSILNGGVWFGSDSPTFPTTTEMAILRAASSLAATAIQASRIQHERDQSYKAKDEFLAMLGHELRNPLAPIRAGATVLQMDEVAPATIKKTAAIIERQVKHMTGLVDSLLDVSRLSTGALILAEDVIDMKEVLHDAFEQISPFFDSKAHSVSMHISNDEAYVYGDKSRLVQVVSNLLNNASKYTANGGSIEVVLETQAEAVIVKVTDNGIGIESAMLLKVFHLFTQAKRSADRFGGGLGVGLALAKQLVELHDGRLTAHSAGIGLGATFEVRLKRMTGSAELRLPVFEGSAPRTTVRPLRILVVDDNRDAAEVIAEMLKIFGHEVFIDFHPLDALRRAPEVNPDIYLLDIGLPEIDGYELARRLKLDSRLDRFTLVALTGYGQVEDQRKAYSAGFNFHCVKPIDIEHLSSILSEVSTQISANPR